MSITHKIRFNNLQGDIFGGITAAIVSLPLTLAFGVASGVGLLGGLYGAVCLGFFAALFCGTPTLISEPKEQAVDYVYRKGAIADQIPAPLV